MRAGSPRTIIVGYEGSEPARRALEYALREAQAQDRIVIAYAYSNLPEDQVPSLLRPAIANRRRRGQAVLEAIPLEGNDELIDRDYETRLLEGSAAPALCRLAASLDADEIVVGAHGHNPLRALLGTTSRALLTHAGCPVTVIPAARVVGETAHPVTSGERA